ncbi:14 kDa zinc-binding protein [Platanthera guangdongensis]|uniref:14 kDa zinc-binding protein n=1 Tax=Platanthera guangdongensis TaxID=2320717 RepID=A0ABR2MD08_9ASPA
MIRKNWVLAQALFGWAVADGKLLIEKVLILKNESIVNPSSSTRKPSSSSPLPLAEIPFPLFPYPDSLLTKLSRKKFQQMWFMRMIRIGIDPIPIPAPIPTGIGIEVNSKSAFPLNARILSQELELAEERHIAILGYLLYAAKIVATQEGLDDGYRVVINDGPHGCLPIGLSSSYSSSRREADGLAAWLMFSPPHLIL